ncbi:MAG: hypothetical protein A3H37_06350 [Candidatus Schekmanbacteria bacterium RIFCSPLOWO2_02_FULL_38_14]|nr:MAG: hypothetical protein A3H37_06350 [Candidatus Schekmanbacteria bacterium RIFCSPLOWO2_02_FULL_38_14]
MGKKRFENKVALITGSATGIGKNIARAFGQEGAHVAICDIDLENGKKTEMELIDRKISASFFHVDLSLKGAPYDMVRQVVQRYGKLDILVNNARSGQRTSFFEEDENSWEKGISVTLRAAFFASQEACRVMSEKGGGNIINISSVAALLACHESPVYHIAKAGMLQMTRYLAMHTGKFGVRVNTILPGFIVRDEHKARYDQDNNKNYREMVNFIHPSGHIGCSDDVANLVLFLCSSESSFINGQCIIIDGGLTLQEQSSLVFRFEKKE